MPFHSGKGASRRIQAVSCETCSNYVYDEDYGYYVCEADLDEDEMAAFLGSRKFECPYYHMNDEYLIARKQM